MKDLYLICQRLANFFCKGPYGKNVFNTVSHVVSVTTVTTTQLSCCSKEEAIDNMKVNNHGGVSIKLYL